MIFEAFKFAIADIRRGQSEVHKFKKDDDAADKNPQRMALRT